MKLAIYGDSFAVDGYDYSWPSVLVELLSPSIYKNFAYVGTSIDYSYYHFLENYKDFDVNIVVLTDPSRYTLWIDNKPTFCMTSFAPTLLNSNKDQYSKKLLRKVNAFSNYEKTKRVEFPDWQTHYAFAMIDSMLLKDPNVILINGMLKCHPLDKNYYNLGMMGIQNLDYKHLNLDMDKTVEKGRACHMSRQQNKEFANYMVSHIKGDIDIHETLELPEEFYTVSKNFKEAKLKVKKWFQ